MKYTKKFKSLTDARSQGKGGLNSPHLDIIEGFSVVNYHSADTSNFTCKFDDEGNLTFPKYNYIVFSAATEQNVSFTNATSPVLQYSFDNKTWSDWDYSALTFGTSEHPRVYIKGVGNTTFSEYDGYNNFRFGIINSFVALSGNVMGLLDYEETPSAIPNAYCFAYLFSGASFLKTISSDFLPSKVLKPYCYHRMFYDCGFLTTPPELPATALSYYCYSEMFCSCYRLATAPELPAMDTQESCYAYMFADCYALTKAPELPATGLTTLCYYGMFSNCTALTIGPSVLPATTLAVDCYYSQFKGCSALTSAPVICATTVAEGACYEMFQHCAALETPPSILPATNLSGCSRCYEYMFDNCENLKSTPELPATIVSDNCYYSMFGSCYALTSGPSSLPATDLSGCDSCYHGMFAGCTSLVSAPQLPAATLTANCYNRMFKGCTSLAVTPELNASTLVSQCYYLMFEGCTSLNTVTCFATNPNASGNCTYNWMNDVPNSGTFYLLGTAAALWPEGISGIPSSWDVIYE